MVHPDNAILFRLERNELPSHEKTRRKLKCILLSERRQPEKATCCMIPTIIHPGKGKTMEILKDQWFPGVWGEGGMNRWSIEKS